MTRVGASSGTPAPRHMRARGGAIRRPHPRASPEVSWFAAAIRCSGVRLPLAAPYGREGRDRRSLPRTAMRCPQSQSIGLPKVCPRADAVSPWRTPLRRIYVYAVAHAFQQRTAGPQGERGPRSGAAGNVTARRRDTLRHRLNRPRGTSPSPRGSICAPCFLSPDRRIRASSTSCIEC